MHKIQIFDWVFVHVNFMIFSFKIFKMHLPYQVTSITFDEGFDLYLGGFVRVSI